MTATPKERHLAAVLAEQQAKDELDHIEREIHRLQCQQREALQYHMEAVQAVNEAREAVENINQPTP
jgi:hypothetical protein